jgi:ketosteroid isomerase-like protein
MRKLFAFTMLATVILFSSCGNQAGSPKGTVTSFLNAMKSGDLKEIKKHITKSDVNMMEVGESLAKTFGQGDKLTEKMQNEFKEKSKNVTFDVKDEKVEGDKATVNVAITDNGKTETQAFELKKEEGAWKVSLMSTGLNKAGLSSDELQKGADELKQGIDDLKNISADSINGMLKKGAEELKKINMDSLAEKMKAGSKDVEKMLEELKKIKTN